MKTKSIDEFDSPEAKILYAKSCLTSLSGLSWCDITKNVVDELPLTESQADSLIQSIALVEALRQSRDSEKERREFERLRSAAKSGFVYLIHLFDDCYKIGKSLNPATRLKSIISIAERLEGIDCFEGIDPKLILIVQSKDIAWAEQELHCRFEDSRDRGLSRYSFESQGLTTEIFRLSSEQVQEIKKIEVLNPKWFLDGKTL